MNMALNFSTLHYTGPKKMGKSKGPKRTIEKRLRFAHNSGQNMATALSDYLLMYHETPHSVTGKTPSELMFSRNIKVNYHVTKLNHTFEEYREKDLYNK